MLYPLLLLPKFRESARNMWPRLVREEDPRPAGPCPFCKQQFVFGTNFKRHLDLECISRHRQPTLTSSSSTCLNQTVRSAEAVNDSGPTTKPQKRGTVLNHHQVQRADKSSCTNCRGWRSVCEGGRPCSRCRQHSIRCVYMGDVKTIIYHVGDERQRIIQMFAEWKESAGNVEVPCWYCLSERRECSTGGRCSNCALDSAYCHRFTVDGAEEIFTGTGRGSSRSVLVGGWRWRGPQIVAGWY